MADKSNCAKCGKPAPAKPHPVMKHMVSVTCPDCGVTNNSKDAPVKPAPAPKPEAAGGKDKGKK